jgi:hypothetical protein
MRSRRGDPGRLGQCFREDNTRDERVPRKMAREHRIAAAKRACAFGGHSGSAGKQLLHKDERRPMGQRIQPVTYHSSLPISAINEIRKFPAAVDPTDTGAVAVVVERGLGELRRRHHVSAFLHEFFR